MRHHYAALLGVAYAAAHGILALVFYFVRHFPFDNATTSRTGVLNWLLGVGLLLFFLAALTAAGILMGNTALALGSYLITAGAGIALLVWAVGSSHHSDGLLITLATMIEGTGCAGVVLTRRA